MKVLSNWRHLEEYGIFMLTGEACAMGMRLLCDLTAEGVDWVSSFLGAGEIDRDQWPDNWNSGEDDNPHIASVMLLPNAFAWLAAYIVGQDADVTHVFITKGGEVHAREKDDPEMAEYLRVYRDHLVKVLTTDQITRDRNTHQMSGRTG